MITVKRFRRIEAILRAAGHGDAIEWSESVMPPVGAGEFAEQAIYVICNSGMKNAVAVPIFERCMIALRGGNSASTVFGHPGKRVAIDLIWADRDVLFAAYRDAPDQLAFLRDLPWIGGVTAYHLAKNLGGDFAKPDVHLERLARRDRTTTHKLCKRLARRSGYRIGTIDTILWRACADGVLNSAVYEVSGWKAAFRPKALRQD